MDAATGDAATTTAPRRVEAVYAGPDPHWVGDGFRVMGYFAPERDLARTLSPFLLLDYHAPYDYPPSSGVPSGDARRGVGAHPHRGFETVTVAFEGSVAHHDSTGAGGVIGPGDVQWMTAGSGILHKEYHADDFARTGGRMHMMQIWVNLPAAHKMDAPGYQLLTADRIGSAVLPGGAGTVRVIAGSFAGKDGAARTMTPVDLLDVRLNAGGRADLHLAPGHTAAVLVMRGELRVDGERTASASDLVLFVREDGPIVLEATSEAHVLVLGGAPIDEPIAQYGPFVMNSEREIRQAISDFKAGRFGALDD